MKKLLFAFVGVALLLSACGTSQLDMRDVNDSDEFGPATIPTYETGEVATFAGGCFWCMEPAFEPLEGVLEVVVGYTGGEQETANYKDVLKGTSGHREAVQINYDPEQIDYMTLLETFFQQINPTDGDGQFTDRGFQYTTAIYYHDDEQKRIAQRAIEELEAGKKFDKPVATKITEYDRFFLAEEYHQDFYIKSSAHYERYAKGSGRKGFIKDNWAKEDALKFSR